jgi:hypothetical protein
MARKVSADDARFGERGRPAFLITTEVLRRFGLTSLSDLPPCRGVSTYDLAMSSSAFPSELLEGDNQRAEWTDDHGR